MALQMTLQMVFMAVVMMAVTMTMVVAKPRAAPEHYEPSTTSWYTTRLVARLAATQIQHTVEIVC